MAQLGRDPGPLCPAGCSRQGPRGPVFRPVRWPDHPLSPSLSTATTVPRGAAWSPWKGFLGDRAARVMGGRAGGWTGASCCGAGVALHSRRCRQSRVRPGRVLQAQREGAQRLHGRGRRPLLHQRYLAPPRPRAPLGPRATVGAAGAPGGRARAPWGVPVVATTRVCPPTWPGNVGVPRGNMGGSS